MERYEIVNNYESFKKRIDVIIDICDFSNILSKVNELEKEMVKDDF